MKITMNDGDIGPLSWHLSINYKWVRLGRTALVAKHTSVPPVFSEKYKYERFYRITESWRVRIHRCVSVHKIIRQLGVMKEEI